MKLFSAIFLVLVVKNFSFAQPVTPLTCYSLSDIYTETNEYISQVKKFTLDTIGQEVKTFSPDKPSMFYTLILEENLKVLVFASNLTLERAQRVLERDDYSVLKQYATRLMLFGVPNKPENIEEIHFEVTCGLDKTNIPRYQQYERMINSNIKLLRSIDGKNYEEASEIN